MEMSDTLIGAMVGGILAIAGGFLGALLAARAADRRAEATARAELNGAVTALMYEMQGIASGLHSSAEWKGGPVPDRISRLAFERSCLVLAQGLPPGLYATISLVYGFIPILQFRIDEWVRTGKLVPESRRTFELASVDFLKAIGFLAEHAHRELNILQHDGSPPPEIKDPSWSAIHEHAEKTRAKERG
jgi:hypothetical protein